MEVRKYRSDDYGEVIKLFHDTIHSVNAADYSETQLNAWAPDIDTITRENELDGRFSRDYTIVVEKDGIIVGFGNGSGRGYFDCLYVHKDYQRMGVATLIADDIENYSRREGVQTMTTDASITAKPFFEKRGYLTRRRQSVQCRGQLLTNFKMEKTLG